MTDKANAPQGGVTDARTRLLATVTKALGDAYADDPGLSVYDAAGCVVAALQSQAPDVGRLPMLPPSVDAVWADWRGGRELLLARDTYYTAEQMRAYALAALSHQPAAQGSDGEVSACLNVLVRICNRGRSYFLDKQDSTGIDLFEHLAAEVGWLKSALTPSPGSSEGASHE